MTVERKKEIDRMRERERERERNKRKGEREKRKRIEEEKEEREKRRTDHKEHTSTQKWEEKKYININKYIYRSKLSSSVINGHKFPPLR